MRRKLPTVSKGCKVLALLSITMGCSPSPPQHAEWRNVCVASHQETTITLLPVLVGSTTTMIPLPQELDVCDLYERKCVAGTDGSNICHAEPAQ
jgi:hypothetical protein